MSIVTIGIQAVAMPLSGEFQFTREIEDRLLAPMKIGWLAVEKILAGGLLLLQKLVLLNPLVYAGEGLRGNAGPAVSSYWDRRGSFPCSMRCRLRGLEAVLPQSDKLT